MKFGLTVDNTQNKVSRFRIRNLVEINDESLERMTKAIKLNLKLQ